MLLKWSGSLINMKILMFIAMFFLIAAFFIISQNNLHLGDTKELKEFNQAYVSWLSGIFDNFKQTTGYVVKMDWLPN